MKDVRLELTSVFRNVFDDESLVLRDDMTAKDVRGWDSLTHVDLMVAVEKHFRIKVTTREVVSMKNVGELVQLVERKRTAQ